jgi:hypothetical protein
MPRRTTPLILAQGQNPIGQAELHIGLHVSLAQPDIAPHDHIATVLTPCVL